MKNMLWIDLEMTGLNEKVDHILEIAIVVTDMNFKVLEEYHRIVHQPPEFLQNMDDWVRKVHTSSGLIAQIPNGTPMNTVENEVLDLISRHFDPKERIPLAGNSVGNDKRFIDAYWPKFAARLHYRIVDVSSFKEIFREKYGLGFSKQNAHRAVDDIHESIRELSFYLSHVVVPAPAAAKEQKP